MPKSKFLGLNLNDAWKGILTALATAVVANLTNILGNGWPTSAELLDTLRIGLYAAGGYILKNLLTNSDGEILKKEN